ncbi:MAG: minichromosome maintenance protein MCM, partial [Methanosarcina sp.]|nr:minichromosome maintenance protein MCM [Methanosarcina sp.]
YLKIQEPLEKLRGRQPEFLYVSCSEDLAGLRKPGEKVIITGILKSRIKVKKEGKTKFLDFLFIANSIQLSDKDYENIEITTKDEEDIKELSKKPDIKNIIISSVAPSIYGHENIKEGIALQLFSGNSIDLPDGTHKRGDIHSLMVGDPGVAKSLLLKFVASFAPRAIQVSGRSASAAGLTGAAVHDDFDGKWAIKAGALTMAGDGGVCCVDEMDKMSEKDRASLHDALEQQYINIAKAGVFAKLPTKCSLLGAANPKYGRYDKYEGIAELFNLGAALLSRIDLLYVMRDTPSVDTDTRLAWHVLDEEYECDEIIDLELLRKYIAYSKTHCSPKMSAEAKT